MGEPMLEVRALRKAFGPVIVADCVDLDVARGEIVGIIGPNGAGKSSVFNLIAGSLPSDGGSVRLEGREIAGRSASERARAGIFRAFQIPQPFAQLTVYENILAAATFGRSQDRAEAEEKACEVIDLAGLSRRAGERAGAIPLLDRKRLELAKGLASSPSVLMLDEIGGGLTDPEVEELVDLIRTISKDYAILWIEHIAHALRPVANRIVLLNFGKVLMDGPPAEVMESAVVRKIYMGIEPSD